MDNIVIITDSQLTALADRVAAAVDELRQDLEAAKIPELMNREQLAAYVGCHPSTVNRLMRAGMPYELLLKAPRFRKEDVDRWMKDRV